MNTAEVERLFAYHQWATARILRTAERVGESEFITAPANHSASLRDLLVHLLGAERVWRVRFETGQSPKGLNAAEFPTVDVLRAAFEEQHQAMRRFIATLDDAALGQTIQFRRTSGELSAPFVRWDVLVQLLMHGVSHRSEAAEILTAYGQSPGDLDFLVYLAETSR